MEKQELLTLYDEYADMVYRLALAYLHSRPDAEDAVQAVFLKLIEGRAEPIPGKEKALLAQMTVNYCRDELRAARRKTVPLDEMLPFEDKRGTGTSLPLLWNFQKNTAPQSICLAEKGTIHSLPSVL